MNDSNVTLLLMKALDKITSITISCPSNYKKAYKQINEICIDALSAMENIYAPPLSENRAIYPLFINGQWINPKK